MCSGLIHRDLPRGFLAIARPIRTTSKFSLHNMRQNRLHTLRVMFLRGLPNFLDSVGEAAPVVWLS